MSSYPSFSYKEYRYILDNIRKKLPILDYSKVNKATESYCIIRHDIEFSLDRAHLIAKIESDLDISTSYFVQITNNTYNALSKQNIEIINDIISMGHKIGVHFTPSSSDADTVRKEYYILKNILEKFINQKIDRFSFHRPNIDLSILKVPIGIDNAINVYGPLFFQYFEGEIPDNLEIKYLSDSQHQWRYGHPIEAIEQGHKKLQILFHPFSWSEEGGDNKTNFKRLLNEKKREDDYFYKFGNKKFPY